MVKIANFDPGLGDLAAGSTAIIAGSVAAAAVGAHAADTTDAHQATGVAVLDQGSVRHHPLLTLSSGASNAGRLAATNVEAAIAEISGALGMSDAPVRNYPLLSLSSGLGAGKIPHFSAPAAHEAANVTIRDAGGFYAGDTVEQALQQAGQASTAAPGVIGGYAPLSSGLLVPVGYLGSGTPDGTKALFGDGTWKVPGGGGIGDRRWQSGSNPYGLDDEFADGSLDAAWIRVDKPGDAGHLVYTEANDALSLYHYGSDAASECHALVRSLGGRSYPLTIEVAVRYYSRYAYNNLMLGPILADGITYGAGKQIWVMPYTNDGVATSVQLSMRSFANYSGETATVNAGNWQVMGGPFFLRLRWTAADTFYADASPDGISWHQFAGPVTLSFTPTYAGVTISTWGQLSGLAPVIGSYEFFRAY